MTEPAFVGDPLPGPTAQCARSLLVRGRTLEQDGRALEAMRVYEAAIQAAEFQGDQPILAEALRMLAVARHGSREFEAARKTATRSHRLAADLGDKTLTAQALNTLAGFDIDAGAHESARARLADALELCDGSESLRGDIEQNLAIVASMHGDHRRAAEHCERALEAFLAAGDDDGCARVYHNMGALSAAREQWDDAELHYHRSRAIAKKLGDVHLQAMCLLDQTEVLIARQHYDAARECADSALSLFNQLGDSAGKAGVYRFLGVIDRASGAPALAEGHLRLSIELATKGQHPLQEAEAKRELALLYQERGQNLEAFEHLNAAHRLFGRLAARVDRVDVARKRTQIERAFLQMVRGWGQSIESADRYTHGHSERVATFAYGVGRILGLNKTDLMTIRVGAYLHDVGKVRVPMEILNKPGPLTPAEFAVIKRHPEWGVDLLESAEFPWDILPIIRWHHEKLDGSGYPDGLRGDDIPLAAQIICVADVYDALTTDRSYRPARSKPMTLSIMRDHHYWWRPDVFDAFMRTIGR